MADLNAYLESCIPEAHKMLEELCLIPAPSGFEDERAAYVKAWLENIGAEGVIIDEAKNVIFPLNCEGKDDLTVFAAHTDTVFPAKTKLEFTRDEKNFYCPGVGDDTVCLVMMLLTVKYVLQNKIQPKGGILFVANSCAEGLGNLKGTRQLFKDYEGRIGRFYTFDGRYDYTNDHCVGSHRYVIESKTPGGHSFSAFGNANAITALARLIADLYTVKVPEKKGTKTTYNVGMIEGGTSVNTIAQSAKMLYEYRSDDAECLAIMEKTFGEKLAAARAQNYAEFSVELVGVRPCQGEIDEKIHGEMVTRVRRVCSEETGKPCMTKSGSTDCNIPMSMGVPAVCVGSYQGGGAHTLEEWLEIDSIPVGLRITARLILDYFNA